MFIDCVCIRVPAWRKWCRICPARVSPPVRTVVALARTYVYNRVNRTGETLAGKI